MSISTHLEWQPYFFALLQLLQERQYKHNSNSKEKSPVWSGRSKRILMILVVTWGEQCMDRQSKRLHREGSKCQKQSIFQKTVVRPCNWGVVTRDDLDSDHCLLLLTACKVHDFWEEPCSSFQIVANCYPDIYLFTIIEMSLVASDWFTLMHCFGTFLTEFRNDFKLDQ